MQTPLLFPQGYNPILGVRQTEVAIRQIKEFFQTNLAFELNLMRVTAPLFVLSGTGINDDLNGIDRPVAFPIKSLKEALRLSNPLQNGSDYSWQTLDFSLVKVCTRI
jgi:asparagine synthetase A